jgi:hypothetical protein
MAARQLEGKALERLTGKALKVKQAYQNIKEITDKPVSLFKSMGGMEGILRNFETLVERCWLNTGSETAVN